MARGNGETGLATEGLNEHEHDDEREDDHVARCDGS